MSFIFSVNNGNQYQYRPSLADICPIPERNTVTRGNNLPLLINFSWELLVVLPSNKLTGICKLLGIAWVIIESELIRIIGTKASDTVCFWTVFYIFEPNRAWKFELNSFESIRVFS